MSGKRGRKCSMVHCRSYQHTHKNLSFFRFPKDPERCKVWIEKSGRIDLIEKGSVYEDRVCQLHFTPNMFLNDYRNRLQQHAVPVLYLDGPPPPPPKPASLPIPRGPRGSYNKDNRLHTIRNGSSPPMLVMKSDLNMLDQPSIKRVKIDTNDELLEIMAVETMSPQMESNRSKKYCIAPQQTYLDAAKEMRETGMSFRKAAEKYNVNYVTLRRFCNRLNKQNGGILNTTYPPRQILPQPQQQQYRQNGSSQMNTSLPALPRQKPAPMPQNNFMSSIQMQLQSHFNLPPPSAPQQPPNNFQKRSPIMPNQLSPPKAAQFQQQKQSPPKPTPTIAQNATPPPAPLLKRPRQIFSIQQEEELAVFVRDASNYYNGMNSKDVRTLAFVYGVCNQVDMPIGWREVHQASFDWCLGFIKRNKLTSMMTSFRNSSNNNSNQAIAANQSAAALPVVEPNNSATIEST